MGRKKLGMVGLLLFVLYIANILQSLIAIAYLWISEMYFPSLKVIETVVLLCIVTAMIVLLLRGDK